MVRHHKTKINIPMCVAAVLFCLTLFSCHLCGGLYAKYTVLGSGEDAARVAKFDITDKSVYFTEDIVFDSVAPGEVTKTITVTNKSEVAVAYVVTVKNITQNIPYSFSVNDSASSMDECTVTCYLEPNSGETEISIVANWDPTGALNYMGMVDLVRLTITAQQVD